MAKVAKMNPSKAIDSQGIVLYF